MRDEIAIFLCDITGIMAKPWVEAGYRVILVDPQHPEGVTRYRNMKCGHLQMYGNGLYCEACLDAGVAKSHAISGRGCTTTKVGHIIDHPETWEVIRDAIKTGRVAFVGGFPPCTDLAVSGSKWFESKREKDPAIQFKAMHVVWQCQVIGELSGAAWFAENPVSMISSLWRRPDHSFHPYQFTGLAENDNYTKKTCLWTGGGFVMPAENVHPSVAEAIALVKATCGRMVQKKKAMEALPDNELVDQWYPDNRIHDCPPSDERANIRSATPEGFAKAVFLANAPHLKAANDNNQKTTQVAV